MELTAREAQADTNVRCQLADGFDYPVGKPEAVGYYKSRGFIPKAHLGEDWNGNGGGDTDLGDPVYAIGRGVVILSENVHHGWGNVLIVRHAYREKDGSVGMIDSLYGHVLERKVKVGDRVERGQLIASVGTGDGLYPAHLHLEIRKNLTIGMNCFFFARDYSNYYSPTAFIVAHRHCTAESRKFDIPIDTFAPFGEKLTDAQAQRGQAVSASGANGAGAVTAKPSDTPPPPKVAEKAPETKPGKNKSADASPVAETSTPSGKKRLVIPVNNEPSRPRSRPSSTDTAETEPASSHKSGPAPSSPPSSSDADKSDFWTRMKAKLSNGQMTPGTDEFRK